MNYYATQGWINIQDKKPGCLLVKAESFEEAKQKLYLYRKENADIADLSPVTDSDMWTGMRQAIETTELVELSNGVFAFADQLEEEIAEAKEQGYGNNQ